MPPSNNVHLSIDLHKTVWWTFLAWIWAFFWRVQAVISRNWSNRFCVKTGFFHFRYVSAAVAQRCRIQRKWKAQLLTVFLDVYNLLANSGSWCTSKYVCFSGAMDSHRRSASEGCRRRRSVVFFFHFFYVQAVPLRASGTELWRRMSVQKMLHSRMWTVGTRKRSGTVESSEFGESCEFCTWTLQRLAFSWYFEHEPFQAKDRDSLTDWQRAYDNRPSQRADSRLNQVRQSCFVWDFPIKPLQIYGDFPDLHASACWWMRWASPPDAFRKAGRAQIGKEEFGQIMRCDEHYTAWEQTPRLLSIVCPNLLQTWLGDCRNIFENTSCQTSHGWTGGGIGIAKSKTCTNSFERLFHTKMCNSKSCNRTYTWWPTIAPFDNDSLRASAHSVSGMQCSVHILHSDV